MPIPDATAAASPGSSSNKGQGIGMSLPWAEFISFWANWVLVGALIVGVIATWAIVVSGNIKEASSRASIAEANARAAEANQKAETERLARVKIEQRLADRQLTDTQLQSIADKIRPFAGQEFDITTFWDLKEPLAIANRIYAGITLGGWKYIPREKSGFLLGGMSGVQVWIHPSAGDVVKRGAEALISALNGEELGAVLKLQNPQNPIDNKIHINVGTKA